jgi:NAD dependent epimerase/dehydratase family enzyme
MSWISLHDAVRAIRFAIKSSVRGPVNVITPNPVTNAEFAKTLGAVLRRPAVIPVPRLALMLLYGEMAKGTILSSQRGSPDALTRAGFAFDEPHLDGALRHELSRYDAAVR